MTDKMGNIQGNTSLQIIIYETDDAIAKVVCRLAQFEKSWQDRQTNPYIRGANEL